MTYTDKRDCFKENVENSDSKFKMLLGSLVWLSKTVILHQVQLAKVSFDKRNVAHIYFTVFTQQLRVGLFRN